MKNKKKYSINWSTLITIVCLSVVVLSGSTAGISAILLVATKLIVFKSVLFMSLGIMVLFISIFIGWIVISILTMDTRESKYPPTGE